MDRVARPAGTVRPALPAALASTREPRRVVTEGFTAAAAANACVVHGPLRPAEAAEQVVGVVLGHAHGGDVAVAHDALLEGPASREAVRDSSVPTSPSGPSASPTPPSA
jgi:hypothetical protein